MVGDLSCKAFPDLVSRSWKFSRRTQDSSLSIHVTIICEISSVFSKVQHTIAKSTLPAV